MTARHLALVTNETLRAELAVEEALERAAIEDAATRDAAIRENYKGGVVDEFGFHPINKAGGHGEPIDINSAYPADWGPVSAADHAATYQRRACPNCGDAGRYQVSGICRSCGWPISKPVPTDFPAPL